MARGLFWSSLPFLSAFYYGLIAIILTLPTVSRLKNMANHRLTMYATGSLFPISNVNQGTLAALRYARMLSDDITAVHISLEPEDTEKVRKKWERWGRGNRLVIVDSPYRLFLEPLLDYIDEILSSRQSNETITIVVPHFVPEQKLHNMLAYADC